MYDMTCKDLTYVQKPVISFSLPHDIKVNVCENKLKQKGKHQNFFKQLVNW